MNGSNVRTFAPLALGCAALVTVGIGSIVFVTDGFGADSTSWSAPRTVSAPHAVIGPLRLVSGQFVGTRVIALAQRQVSSAQLQRFRVGGSFGSITTGSSTEQTLREADGM
jgi:hypothetical protein